MTPFSLHIIALGSPYPANYGGAIDMYFKIEALYELGVEIHLHAVGPQPDDLGPLGTYCKSIQYYPKSPVSGALGMLLGTPYIVGSRPLKAVLAQIKAAKTASKGDFGVILEGLHVGAALEPLQALGIPVALRMHNNEAAYYQELSKVETGFWKKLYLKFEALLLKSYQPKILQNATKIAAISRAELAFFQAQTNGQVHWIPPFFELKGPTQTNKTGPRALYHGNLKVAENQAAVRVLIAAGLHELTVAGGGAPADLVKEMDCAGITYLAATGDEMGRLINTAKVHVLPTLQSTGVKLKLLHALHTQAPVVCNRPMVEGTGLENCVTLVEDYDGDWQAAIDNAIPKDCKALKEYNTKRLAAKLLAMLKSQP